MRITISLREAMGYLGHKKSLDLLLKCSLYLYITLRESLIFYTLIIITPAVEMNFIYEDNTEGLTRSVREAAPTNYIFKVVSFSLLSKNSITRYDSNTFESEGYKWKLALYPEGSDISNRKDHVSLYLCLAETSSPPSGWEVNVVLRLFLYDQIRDKYLKVEANGGRIRRFHALKTELGFSQFIPITMFNDPANGYLINDTCVFGAELFVSKNKAQGECLSMIHDATAVNYSWKLERFSQLKDSFYHSGVFIAGNYKWHIQLCPRGSGSTKDASISMYLTLDSSVSLTNGQKVYADCKLRIRDQKNTEYIEKKLNYWYTEAGSGYGFPNFMTLKVLNDTAKGFLVNDTCIIEAEVLVLGLVSKFPPT